MSDPTKAVFLSYAHEDTDAAKRIAEALRGFGVEVWFDQSELRGGDQWDAKIRKQIRECALFIPIISQQTEERAEGYFRREWKIAIDRTQDMGSSRVFVVPVVIDGTAEKGAEVPEEFMRFQWTRLVNGEPTPDFVAQVKRLLEGPKKVLVEAGHHRPVQRDEGVAAPKKPQSARPGWPKSALWLAILLGAFIGVAVYWATRAPVPGPAALPKSEPVAKAAPAADKSAPADKSIAVLAFADLSEARNSEYFSDGISEELLNVLAKVPGLRVAARTSAFFFKGKNLPITEIAAKLNVAYIVEGSVQRAGERVKITAQLIKAADGFHVWSDTFTRDAKDVFAVQEEIAGRIAKELSLKLGVSSAAAGTAINPQAFELYLQGRQAWNLRTPEGYDQAEEALNEALSFEPNFARAHAALADVWLLRNTELSRANRFDQRHSPAYARITAQVERALALDPNLAEAHATLGNIHWQTWRMKDAVRELRKAIALNPNYASAHQWLGRVLLVDGRVDEAEASLKHAAELDPLSHRILDNYTLPLAVQGRLDEALAVIDRALALRPDSLQGLSWKSLILSALGRHDEAVALIRRTPVAGTAFEIYAVRVFARAGLQAEAEQVSAQVAGGRYAHLKFYGLADLGRREEALAAMDPAAMSVGVFGDVMYLAVLDPIRHDPRFTNMLATLGLTEAHARAQAWRAAHPLGKPDAKK